MSGGGSRLSRQIVDDLRRRGWRVETGRHYKAYPPDGGPFVVISSTMGTRSRTYRNIQVMIRRAERGYYAEQAKR